mgnify:CR=1 FL=1
MGLNLVTSVSAILVVEYVPFSAVVAALLTATLAADQYVAIIDPDNARSIRVIEKAGFAIREASTNILGGIALVAFSPTGPFATRGIATPAIHAPSSTSVEPTRRRVIVAVSIAAAIVVSTYLAALPRV